MKKNNILDDIIKKDLKVVFCGMAVGLTSKKEGHYYADPRNQFWSILHKARFTPTFLMPNQDSEVLKYKLGLTDLVKDQVGRDRNIKVTDYHKQELIKKIEKFQPLILAFNGKKAAKSFLRKGEVGYYGPCSESPFSKTKIWILPSTSPANTRWWNPGHWHTLAQRIKD